jgi:hypothetical protein
MFLEVNGVRLHALVFGAADALRTTTAARASHPSIRR